ncbi:MAG: hypothetical protein IJ906_06935 [Oscillospiraceae bacterium]|nr:hypothetical protein [Oscillospiraceae bacterium]
MHTLSKRAAAMLLSVLLLTLSVLTVMPARAYSYRENGVDVSAWQGDVDWQVLAANNDMRFVILRACKLPDPSDTAEKTHSFFKDANFEYNYENARAVGLKVGCYCRLAAGSYAELISVTQQYIDVIYGKEFDMPVYIDAEDDAMAAIAKREGKSVLTQYLIEALDMIAAAGHHPGIYANLTWYSNYVDANMIRARGYDLWLARYTHDCDSTDFSSQYTVWQYSNKGSYAGVSSSAIDLDVSYYNYQYAGDHGRVHDTRYDGKYPAYAYPNRDMTPYQSDCVTAFYGQTVSASSPCYVQEVYTNGWCRVRYDSFGGYRIGYLPLEAFEEAPTEPPTEPPTEDPEKDLVKDSLWEGILPLQAYPAEDKSCTVYEADCVTPKSDLIGANQEVTIEAGFTNGWCRVKYGEATGYLPLSDFFLKERKQFGQLYASAEVDTFLRSESLPTGSIEGKSLIVYTGETDRLIQVIYSENGVRHVTWVTKREWYSILLKILDAHIHGKQPLLDRQVPMMDCDGDGVIDVYDLALLKMRLDRLPSEF